MKAKALFTAGAAVGYVLGTRAGRERYEQIVRAARALRTNPKVQQATIELEHRADDVAHSVTRTATGKASSVAHAITEKVPGRVSSMTGRGASTGGSTSMAYDPPTPRIPPASNGIPRH